MIRRMLRGFDRWLWRRQGVYEFSDHPDCIFRVQRTNTDRRFPLDGDELAPGAPVLEIHLCNEKVPALPATGMSLAWAVEGRKLMLTSLRELAEYIQKPGMQDVRGIFGVTVVAGDSLGAKRLFRRLGFDWSPADEQRGRLAAFWLNVHGWLLMWAYNHVSLSKRRLLRMRRACIWMSREKLVKDYHV
ncbi:MAG: YkoP family protein [Wenzhouxiangella sp.]